MSIEVTLYPKTATKKELITFLKTNGFNKTDFFLSPSTNTNIHYQWFNDEDYKSFDGVEATIYKLGKLEQIEYNCCPWILHTRTRIWASNYDRYKQNDIIRQAQEKFSGNFYNDHYGDNKDTPLPKNLGHPIENGLFITYEGIRKKINDLEGCIKNFKDPLQENIDNSTSEDIKNLLEQIKPSITLYNSLLPFAISVIEHFFKQTFLILLKYDEKAQKTMSDKTLKVHAFEIIEVRNNNLTLEEIISREYSFQNINDINKAYKHYLDMDIMSILARRRRVKGKIIRILTSIEEVLERRHEMIHAFRFEQDISKEKLIQYLEVVKILIDEVIIFLEKKKKIKIRMYGRLYNSATSSKSLNLKK